ncbi:hypothetical protein L917_00234 [Phytophthora nicotianae]|uniref:Uncharacterized protein n=2 Tax=Phytophthora nicotianae TaxID=4792 RepID=V9G247_PHYNI|nr:hypothetical protein F443_00284 [Phytophthora nicotianae P1569]ETM03559.1 hypothetical protein L917_00234 [Phytophthora nicotianae]ETM56842.1 hypothetical protein L914_00252 [Phytophthora nicotianae]
MDASGDAPAALSEQELLASLPPPPSALPDYPGPSNTIEEEHTTAESASEDAPDSNSRSSSSSKLPGSAAKASSAARSMASKLAKSGRKVLSPLGHSSKPSSKTTATSSPASTTTRSETETSSPSSVDATIADQLGSVASAAGTLTSGLTSSIASASSSFGSLLFASQSSSISNTDEVEERSSSADRAAEEAAAVAAEAAEVLRQVSAQQRMRILEDLVQHRRSDWNYLKAMHEGSNYWLNVALLREQQVMNHVGYKQSIRRGAQFFYLGIGLGRLVGESTHPELLAMDCCQLLEELEFYFSSSTVQGMKLMVATSSTLHEPLGKENSPQYSADEPFRPTMHKWNQRPVYRRLMTPPIPFPLDYREILLSLCDILALIYSKLVEDNSASENLNLFQSIIRFDDRIKKLFIDPVKKEFSAVASQVMAEEMRLVRKAYASGSREEPLPTPQSESENTPATNGD